MGRNKRSLIDRSAIMKPVVQAIDEACNSTRPVWLWGEPGTGREFAARIIHRSRKKGRFLAFDAAASTHQEAMEELHVDPPGWLSLLEGGTLLVKNPWAQITGVETLLERLDAMDTKHRPRLVFSSPTNLADPSCSQLKAILEYRGVMVIPLPPLRMRPQDVGDLAKAFLEEIAAAQGSRPKVLSEDAVNRLAQYHWPGNVSQLRQVCQALTLRNPEERVLRTRQVEAILPTMEQEVPLDHYSLEDLVYAKLSRFMERLRGYHVTGLHRDIMDRMERQLLLLALELSGGSQVEAAKLLGMNRTSLRRRLVRFELTGK